MSACRITTFLSLALLAGGSLAAAGEKPACTTATIQTSSGPVCGLTSRTDIPGEGSVTASVYLGIPYAVPPVGPLRWKHSTPFQGSALLQATAFGNECPQSTGSLESNPSGSRCADGQTLGARQSEDCLFLNVWVPAGVTAGARLPRLPVMVFIHGGNFDQGSSTGGPPPAPGASGGNLYDGTWLAAAGRVIVVTLNYRIGALGFLTHDGQDNFGFGDQILALQWVKTNIAQFGGDPRNVTLFGQSAGAKSVGLHTLVSPRSAGLFQAAILESNALGLPYKSTEQAKTLRDAFCAQRPSLCTAAASACDLIEAQNNFMAAQPLSFATISNFLWTPTVDHVYVTGQPLAAASRLDIPLLLGTNRDEGPSFVYPAETGKTPPDPRAYAAILAQTFGDGQARKIQSLERYNCGTATGCSNQLVNVMTDFAFTCANRHLAIQATRGAHRQPLYIYQFNQVSSFNFWAHTPAPVPQCNGLVCHADELPYVFNTAWQFPGLISFTLAEKKLAQTIGRSWTSFAHRRNPGSAWPLFQPMRSYLLLNESPSTANDPFDATANCSTLWDGIGYETPEILAGLYSALTTAQTHPVQ